MQQQQQQQQQQQRLMEVRRDHKLKAQLNGGGHQQRQAGTVQINGQKMQAGPQRPQIATIHESSRSRPPPSKPPSPRHTGLLHLSASSPEPYEGPIKWELTLRKEKDVMGKPASPAASTPRSQPQQRIAATSQGRQNQGGAVKTVHSGGPPRLSSRSISTTHFT